MARNSSCSSGPLPPRMLGERGEQTPLPSLVFCPLLLGDETWSSTPAYIQEGRKGVTRLPHLLPDVSLAPSQLGSSSSMRALSCSMGQPWVSGCSSLTSLSSMGPSATSLGRSPQTHWWPHCSPPPAGPASPLGAAAPPPTSTVALRASP